MEKIINGTSYECYPLNTSQTFLYYTQLAYTDKVESLNIGMSMQFKGDLDFDVLADAVKDAYKRNEYSRICLTKEGETFLQYILPEDNRTPEIVDLSDMSEAEAYKTIDNWTRQPFNIWESKLNYIKFLKLPCGKSGYYINTYHLQMDAYSAQMFLYDILDLYLAKKGLAPEPKPMRSYVEALKKELAYNGSQRQIEDVMFWKNEIDNFNPIFTDYLRPSRLKEFREKTGNPNLRAAGVCGAQSEGNVIKFSLTAEETKQITDFAEQNKVSVPCILMTGLRCALSSFNERESNISFRLMLNRRATLLEKRSGGTTVNFVNMRSDVPEETSFLDTVKDYAAYQNKIFKHSDLNYVKLLQLQAEKDKNPPLYIYEAIGFSYWSPMAHALPEDIKNNMDLILYSNHASQQNLYISIFHRPQDNALEFCFEYLMNEKPEEDLKDLYAAMKKSMLMGTSDGNITLGKILDNLN